MDDEDLDNVLAGFSRASNSSSSASPLEVSDVAASANQSREHAVEASANLQPVATRDTTTLEPGSTNTSVTPAATNQPARHTTQSCGLVDTQAAGNPLSGFKSISPNAGIARSNVGGSDAVALTKIVRFFEDVRTKVSLVDIKKLHSDFVDMEPSVLAFTIFLNDPPELLTEEMVTCVRQNVHYLGNFIQNQDKTFNEVVANLAAQQIQEAMFSPSAYSIYKPANHSAGPRAAPASASSVPPQTRATSVQTKDYGFGSDYPEEPEEVANSYTAPSYPTFGAAASKSGNRASFAFSPPYTRAHAPPGSDGRAAVSKGTPRKSIGEVFEIGHRTALSDVPSFYKSADSTQCYASAVKLTLWPVFAAANFPSNPAAAKRVSKIENDRGMTTTVALVAESLTNFATYASRNRNRFIEFIARSFLLRIYHLVAGEESVEDVAAALHEIDLKDLESVYEDTCMVVDDLLNTVLDKSPSSSLQTIRSDFISYKCGAEERLSNLISDFDLLFMHRNMAKNVVTAFWSMQPTAEDTPSTYLDRLIQEASLRSIPDDNVMARFQMELANAPERRFSTLNDMLEAVGHSGISTVREMRQRLSSFSDAKIPFVAKAAPRVPRGAMLPPPIVAAAARFKPSVDLAKCYPIMFPDAPVPTLGKLAGAECAACSLDRSWIKVWLDYDANPQYHGMDGAGKSKLPRDHAWMHNPARCSCLHNRLNRLVSTDPSMAYLLEPASRG